MPDKQTPKEGVEISTYSITVAEDELMFGMPTTDLERPMTRIERFLIAVYVLAEDDPKFVKSVLDRYEAFRKAKVEREKAEAQAEVENGATRH